MNTNQLCDDLKHCSFLQTHHEVGWWVILEDFEENKAEQLWKKGVPNDEGYFTLENSKVPQVTRHPRMREQIATLENSKVPLMMTATSSIRLEIKGNITLRWIFY